MRYAHSDKMPVGCPASRNFSRPKADAASGLPEAESRKPTYNKSSMPPAIQCRDLRKTYDGKVEAVRGLNLEIQVGECFGLLGPNGAGKTTTIEILEGLLAPTSGQVSILGHSWEENDREMREWLGISLQETRLSEKLTVRETIELFASFYREPRSSDEVLEQL